MRVLLKPCFYPDLRGIGAFFIPLSGQQAAHHPMAVLAKKNPGGMGQLCLVPVADVLFQGIKQGFIHRQFSGPGQQRHFTGIQVMGPQDHRKSLLDIGHAMGHKL